MTIQQHTFGNGPAGRFEPERFQAYASAELAAATPWKPGICFNPACSSPFVLMREWQIYCCPACARTGEAEMRKWGHKVALPLLTWRQGKYAPKGSDQADLSRVARKYVTHIQSAWLNDRKARMEIAK